MKEDTKIFYLAKCAVLDGKINTTRAYKFGVSDKTFQERGIKTEFSKFFNANPKTSIIQDGVKKEVEAPPELVIRGPASFIDNLESYVKYDYFLNDERFFSTKEEYINVYEETVQRFSKLLETLRKHEAYMNQMYLAYDETDATKNNTLSYYKAQYDKLLDDLKKELKTYSSNKMPSPLNPSSNNTIPSNINIKPISKKDIYSSLLTDFELYNNGSKWYLQHNEYHKGKDPMDYRGAFTVDMSNPNSEKFQWGQNKEFEKYGYNFTQASAKRVIKIFSNANRVKNIKAINAPIISNELSNHAV